MTLSIVYTHILRTQIVKTYSLRELYKLIMSARHTIWLIEKVELPQDTKIGIRLHHLTQV